MSKRWSDSSARPHPGAPIFLVGESMGSAVAMLAVKEGVKVDGVVLGAPAVWGWSTMNPFYKAVLTLAAHIVPRDHVTGNGLDITPCDNRQVLIDMSRDPLVIKETRIDAVYELVSLMDRAYHAGPDLTVPTLILYGDHDEVVPASAVKSLTKDSAGFGRIPDDPERLSHAVPGFECRDRLAGCGDLDRRQSPPITRTVTLRRRPSDVSTGSHCRWFR